MADLVNSSKSKSPVSNSLRNPINTNQAHSGNKQNTMQVSATVVEKRPGGVILDTLNGRVRATSGMPLEEGDRVMVRINYTNKEIKAFVIEKIETSSIMRDPDSSILKYLGGLFNNNKETRAPVLPAAFSYLSPDRSTLKFGNIRTGEAISVQMLVEAVNDAESNALSGVVISNDDGVISVNSSIGIISINTKSNVQPGSKIHFKILGTTTAEEISTIKESVSLLINNIMQNKGNLQHIISTMSSPLNQNAYLGMLQLTNAHHDHYTLLKIFQQNKGVSDFEKWIDEDIIQALEYSDKSNIYTTLWNSVAKLYKSMRDVGIVQTMPWREVRIPIPYTDENATLRVKEDESEANFKLEVNHDEYGEIIIRGKVKYGPAKKIENLSINISHTQKFPENLAKLVRSSFSEHISLSNIKGSLEFYSSALL